MGMTFSPEKQKVIRERFEELIKAQGKSKKEILVAIFNWLRSHSNEKQYKGNPYDLAEKNQKNFYDMLSGNRSVKPDYIIPLEEILGVSLHDVLFGTPKGKVFVNKGLRYSAFVDSLDEYKLLESEDVYKNSDEYNMFLLDYVIDFKSINGLLFLADKYGVSYTSIIPSVKGYSFREILKVICEYDNLEAFNKYFDFYSKAYGQNRFEGWFDDLNNEKCLSSIIGTTNIFSSLLSYKEIEVYRRNASLNQIKGKILVCNPVLFYLLTYILQNVSKYKEKAKMLLSFAIDYNKQEIHYLETHNEQNLDLIMQENGDVTYGSDLYGKLLNYRITERTDFDDDIDKLLNTLNNQLNSFNFKSKPLIGGLSGKRVRIQNGHLVKKHSDNKTEYEFLNLMERSKVRFVPKVFKTFDELDELTYFPGFVDTVINEPQPLRKIYQVLDDLKIIQDISKRNLSGGKVYVHGDLSPMNAVFDRDGKLIGIIDWDLTHIGEEWEDFIYVAWTWLNIGSFRRDNEEIFESLCRMVKHYKPSDEFKKGFADKIIYVMNYRLALTSTKSKDYQQIYEWVGYSKLWVELYREKITKTIG